MKYLYLSVCVCILWLFTSALQIAADPSRMELSVGNDLFSFGVTSNPDDLRSFGISAGIAYRSGWSAELHASGLTNRYTNAAEGRRMDEASLFAAYSIAAFQTEGNSSFDASISPGIGLIAAGDLGFAHMQKLIHKLLFIPVIAIPYETPGEITVHPALSLQAVCRFRSPLMLPYMFIMLSSTSCYAPGYIWNTIGRADIGWSFCQAAYLSMGIGYTVSESLSTRKVHDLVSRFEHGVTAYLESRLGVISLRYRWNLNQLHGYSSLGIDLGGKDHKKADGRDVVLTQSMVLPFRSLATTFRYALGNNSGLFFRNLFYSRKAESIIPAHQTMSAWLIGLDLDVPLRTDDHSWTWFIAAGAGFRRTLLVSYAGGTAYYKVEMDDLHPCIEASAGIRVFQDSRFAWKGAAYGIESSIGIQYNHLQGMRDSAGGIPLHQLNSVYPFFSVGVQAYVGL